MLPKLLVTLLCFALCLTGATLTMACPLTGYGYYEEYEPIDYDKLRKHIDQKVAHSKDKYVLSKNYTTYGFEPVIKRAPVKSMIDKEEEKMKVTRGSGYYLEAGLLSMLMFFSVTFIFRKKKDRQWQTLSLVCVSMFVLLGYLWQGSSYL